MKIITVKQYNQGKTFHEKFNKNIGGELFPRLTGFVLVTMEGRAARLFKTKREAIAHYTQATR